MTTGRKVPRPSWWHAVPLAASAILFAWHLECAAARLDGKLVFLERCGACHGAQKEAKAISPAQFASLQWKNWFRRQKHSRVLDISQRITREEERAILDYLVQKAADSDYPEAAAIP